MCSTKNERNMIPAAIVSCPSSISPGPLTRYSRNTTRVRAPITTNGSQRGIWSRSADCRGSGCGTRTSPGKDNKRNGGAQLGDRQQEPRSHGECGGRCDAERSLQQEDEDPLPHANTAGCQESQETRQVR